MSRRGEGEAWPKRSVVGAAALAGRCGGLDRPAGIAGSRTGRQCGYSDADNNRFASGYPNNPVPNTSPSFIGAGYDWSGVGW